MQSAIRRVLRRIGRVFLGPLHEELKPSREAQLILYHGYKEMAARGVVPGLSEVGFRCFSQFEEDGILLFIFAIIGMTNKTAVEICAGNGTESMTANLILNHGWWGHLFDGDQRKVDEGREFYGNSKDTWLYPPRFNQAWITAANVNDVIRSSGVEGDIDLLALDIDGMDYWVWNAIECIRPRVVVCETHNVIGPDDALTVPYDPNFVTSTPDYHSASLAAMTKLAERRGYRLVGTHRYGFNAFFIANEIAADRLPAVIPAQCLQDPCSREAHANKWPKVKGMNWVKV